MRSRRLNKLNATPEIMLSPMIDLIFLLLVFFIISTMHMVDMKTIPMQLPKAQHTTGSMADQFILSIKQDGSMYLGERAIELDKLISITQAASKANANFNVIVRAEGNADYKTVVKALDALKGSGVHRISLATEQGK